MKTMEEVRKELEHLKQLPPRPRLERLMRPGKGLVEMLEVLAGGGGVWDELGGYSEGIVEVAPKTVESLIIGGADEEEGEPVRRKRRMGRRMVEKVEEGGEV
jgi:hypothetical protein